MIPSYELLSAWEIPLYFIFGFFAAFTALAFVKTLYKCEDVFNAWKFPEYLKPACGGVLIGLIGLYFPQIFGVGYEAIPCEGERARERDARFGDGRARVEGAGIRDEKGRLLA